MLYLDISTEERTMLFRKLKSRANNGQAALEYMLLMAVVVAIIILALVNQLERLDGSTSFFYNQAATGILGEPPPDY